MRRLSLVLLFAGLSVTSAGILSSSAPQRLLPGGYTAGAPRHRLSHSQAPRPGQESFPNTPSGATVLVEQGVPNMVSGPPLPFRASDSVSSMGGTSNPPVTADDIEAKYAPRIRSLQASCEGQLGSLFDAAKAEYDHRQQNGESASDIRDKYYNALEDLQSFCNGQFADILDSMRADLQNRRLPTGVCDAEQTDYDQRVQTVKSEYLQRARQDFR